MYSPDYEGGGTSGGSWKKGEKQPSAFKDVPFAVVFVVHLAAIFVVVSMYGVPALEKHLSKDNDENAQNEESKNLDYSGSIAGAAFIGIVTIIVSTLMMSFMMKFASTLIKMALIFGVVLSFLMVLISIAVGNIIGAIFGLIFAALNLCYAKMVWSRIPFATANLVTALTAVKANFGIIFAAFLSVITAFGWTMVWSVAFIGVYDVSPESCNAGEDGTEVCGKSINYGYMFLLFLSYYWVHQVLVNVIHVSVSGTVGTWWFVPDEGSSCCSSGVTSSLCRSVTYSFGSICFGSLLVAIIQALRQLAQQARNSDDANAILVCIADCILSILESLIQYFNQWAYVYVGVYGYGYIEAGKNVITLFKERGWENVIADDLVSNVLSLVSLVTGGIMAAFGYALASWTNLFDEFDESGAVVASVIGFLLGLVLCSIMMNVIGSAVNATIVLFAEAPAEFQSNYPELSGDMRQAYGEAHPGLL